ncbi:MAG TPA: hypothetical protein VMQ76_12905 [Terracidiphilus sp.]|jgi:hypothetical protein|nr:hypothetical protein [Terracidiphilus sp.]
MKAILRNGEGLSLKARTNSIYFKEETPGFGGWQGKLGIYGSRSRFALSPSSRNNLRSARSTSVVPTGLWMNCWFAHPTLKRGAD